MLNFHKIGLIFKFNFESFDVNMKARIIFIQLIKSVYH